MTREDYDSMAGMLSKIPITETKGSLLSSISRLLRVIDISESSIMIPTLLKDKCKFDAYEMLTLAKILKASILGHNDLVEYYMSESSSQVNMIAQQQHKQNQQLQLQLLNTTQLSQSPMSLRSSLSDQSTSSSRSTPIPTSQTDSSGLGLGSNTTNTNTNSNSNDDGTNSRGSSGNLDNHNHNHIINSNGITNNNIINNHNNNNILMINSSTTLSQNGLNNGDPDATVRLLLQIEQLKTFIPQVTSLFESIIELYKNSVDTITYDQRSHK